MPYKDPVNEHVKRVVNTINRRFIAHTDMLGSTNAINSRNPSVEPQGNSLFGNGRVIGGGQGCAHWTAGTSNKHYDTKTKDQSEMTGGAILGLQDGTLAGDRSKPIQSQTHYDSSSGSESDKDNNKFGALGNALASRLEAAPLGPTAANARSGYAHKDNSPLETQSNEQAKKLGFGKKNKKNKKQLEGEGFFDDVWSGVKSVGSIAKPLVGLIPHYGPAAQQAMDLAGMGKTKRPRRATKAAQPEVKKPLEGEGFFDDVWSGVKSVGSIAKPFVGMIPGYGVPAQMAMSLAGMGQPKECCCPRLKSGKAPKRCKCGASSAMSGGSGFAAGTHMDVGSGVTEGISSTVKTTGAGRGRPRKVGGAVLGLVKAPVAGPLDNTPPAYGNIKDTPQSTSKKELDQPTTKADMPSSTLSGLGKKKKVVVGGARNARAEIVKKVMKDRGCTLMQASSIVKKEGLYKK